MLESLESRKLFAATLPDAAPLAAPTDAEAALSLNFTKIKFDTKVAQQDFHFTKVTFTDVLVSSKVSQQDFHFVMRMPKSSPML